MAVQRLLVQLSLLEELQHGAGRSPYPEIKAGGQTPTAMTVGQSRGWSYQRNARYLGLRPLGRCSRQDPDMKSKKESRKIVTSSHMLCSGTRTPPPSALIPAFTSSCGLLLPLYTKCHWGRWGPSLAVARACPTQCRGQEIAIHVLGLLDFEMEDLILGGLELIFIYQTEVQKIQGLMGCNGGSLAPKGLVIFERQ